MFAFGFALGSVGFGNEMSAHARLDAVAECVSALVYVNRLWLPFHPNTPPLYRSGVVYAAEAPGAFNWWCDIPTAIAMGYGHCVALTAWRIAELREAGENARVRVEEWRPTPDTIDFHIFLTRGNGAVEDPARLLGMP